MLIRVFSVVLMLIVTIFTFVAFFEHTDYIDYMTGYGSSPIARNSRGHMLVTLGLLVIITIVFIALAIKMKKVDIRFLVCSLIICASLMLIPIRLEMATMDFDPLDDISFSVTKWKSSYDEDDELYRTAVSMNVDISSEADFCAVLGTMYIFDGDVGVAQCPLELAISPDTSYGRVHSFNVTSETSNIADIDIDNLEVYVVFDRVAFASNPNRAYTYTPAKVRAK